MLLASKVVLFNWKDSLQADRMLNLLAVLARAAQGIELAEGDNSKVFGHLHMYVHWHLLLYCGIESSVTHCVSL